MLSGEVTNTNFIVFSLTGQGIKPMIYCTWLEASILIITPTDNDQLKIKIDNVLCKLIFKDCTYFLIFFSGIIWPKWIKLGCDTYGMPLPKLFSVTLPDIKDGHQDFRNLGKPMDLIKPNVVYIAIW